MTGALRRSAVVLLALLAAGCGTGGILGSRGEPAGAGPIVVGSKEHVESIIIAKLYGEALAAHGYTVEYRHTLEATDIVAPATDTAGIDLYPEYAGTSTRVLSAAPPSPAAEADAHANVDYAALGQAVLAMAPATHSEGLAVTRATADALGIATLSDLAAHDGDLVFGAPSDCAELPTCLPGLSEVYGLEFAAVEPIDALGLRYQALVDGDIDVAAVGTTDAEIAASDLIVLTDDRGLYPAYNVIPVVDRAYLDEAPADFEALVNAVSAGLSTSSLAALNAAVEIDLRDPTEVAVEWLREQGITERGATE